MVAPHSKAAIELLFKPQEEVQYNFNVSCEIKRKPNKLSLNIKGEGYAVHPLVQLEQADDVTGGTKLVQLRPHPAVNYADFGSVQVLDSMTTKITATNNGKYNFDYVWDLDRMDAEVSLSGGKMGGTLHKAEACKYDIVWSPKREGGLDSRMSFAVAGKYVYNIIHRGTAMKPALRFSFMQYDFGPCFVTQPGGAPVVEETSLMLINHDPNSNISVECNFQKTRTLSAECQPTVLEPGQAMDVPIRFAPRDVKDYAFVIPFVVNGTTKVPVTINGCGINARVELANQSQRRINFGTVEVGSDHSKAIALVNRSKKAITIQLEQDSSKYGGGALSDKAVEYTPQTPVVLQPRETVNLSIGFSPNTRVSQFQEDLMINYAGLTRKLLSIAGKAQGVQVALDTDSMPFGTVVEKSQKTKKISLENSGDLPVTYQWIESSFGPHFTISPLVGKLGPGDNCTFQVVFNPKAIDDDIRQENILCAIPGQNPLTVTCSGACIEQPSDSIQTLTFSAAVRTEQVQNVKINNPTDKDWFITPAMRGEHWIRPGELKIPAKGGADLPLTFFPLAMTDVAEAAEGEEPEEVVPHAGQLFLALPDGTAQLYNLSGTASAPQCSGQLTVETPAKKPARVSIKLANWLGETQKFLTEIEMLEQSCPATFITAANAIEIGPHGEREFHMRFNSFVEGKSKAKITFTNPISREYCFYELTATTTTPEVLETIQMEAPVRQTSRFILSVENPLPSDAAVTMGSLAKPDEWWSCDCEEVRVIELAPLQGNSEGQFEVEYRPIKPTETTEHLLTLMSTDLGTFKYKLEVNATPPTLKQTLRFDVPLGSSQEETLKFRTFAKVAGNATCELSREDLFQVAKSIPVPGATSWDGEDAEVPITFEPTAIGEVRDTVKITTQGGSEFVCELIAVCTPSLPQGPFEIASGGNREIKFRNCFEQSSGWTYRVDSPHFKTNAASGTVNARTDGSVTVSFAPQDGATGVINGKLFVSCDNKPDLAPWVFYLKGNA